MKLFAEVVKEPLEHSDYYEYEDDQKYKWQTLDKYLSYYHVKPSSDKAVDIANALRKCYKKMND